jgi:alpha-galactosidase
MQAVYQKMGDALLRVGRPIVYSLCQYGRNEVWTWGPKVGGNLWRTTDDISDHWQSMDKIGFQQFDIAPYIRPGHWNDPDMLEIGNGGMNSDEYRTHMSLWSLLAAPLLAGNDLRSMSDETKAILLNKEVIAVDQDPDAHPARRVSEAGATAVIVTRLLHGGSVALALFNRADQPQTINATWDSIGLTRRKVQARDLWKHSDVAVTADGYSATVPAHGVVLLKLQVSR